MLGSMVYGLELMMFDMLMAFVGWVMLIGVILLGVVGVACVLGMMVLVTGLGEYFTGRF